MLNYTQIEKLEVARKLVEEVIDSPEFTRVDYYPDLTLGDSLQGINEALQTYYLEGYTPPEVTFQKVDKLSIKITPVKRFCWGLADTLASVALASIFAAAISGSLSIVFWGISDIDKAIGNKLSPDFAAQSHLYRGVAIASVGVLLTSGILAGVVNTRGED